MVLRRQDNYPTNLEALSRPYGDESERSVQRELNMEMMA